MTAESQLTYRSLVYMVARTVALPHGYTLLIWATTMVMIEQHGIPDVIAVFCMLIGACSAYILAGALGVASRLRPAGKLVSRQPRMAYQPYIVATANIVTLATATGACVLAAHFIPVEHVAWLAVGLLGTGVYLLGIAIQSRFVDHILMHGNGEEH